MRRLVDTLLVTLCAGWLAACDAAAPAPPVTDGPRSQRVDVISNGWHTAIIVSGADPAVTRLVPEAAHFPEARFLAFGWGDRDYYPADRATLGLTLRAALIPTPAVMHVAGRAHVPEPREGFEVVQVALTEEGFRQMLRAIAGTFERSGTSPADPVAAGLYPKSRFYAARGRFHLFNTCNTWTARMLRASGVPVSPSGVITADDLMERLRGAIGANEHGATPGPAGDARRPAADGRRSSRGACRRGSGSPCSRRNGRFGRAPRTTRRSPGA